MLRATFNVISYVLLYVTFSGIFFWKIWRVSWLPCTIPSTSNYRLVDCHKVYRWDRADYFRGILRLSASIKRTVIVSLLTTVAENKKNNAAESISWYSFGVGRWWGLTHPQLAVHREGWLRQGMCGVAASVSGWRLHWNLHSVYVIGFPRFLAQLSFRLVVRCLLEDA